MMQDIFTKYKERLVNISGRNRSLVMKRLYKKSAFDICKINRIKEGLDREVVDFLTRRSKGAMQLLDDPYKWQEERENELKKKIEQELKVHLQALNNRQYEAAELRIIEQALKQKFEERKANELEEICKKQEEIIVASQSLTYLLREIQATEKETGRYELFVGYPFVKGLFKDKTFTKAPLLMYPVQIQKNGDAWYLENIHENNVRMNKVFLIALIKYNEANIGDVQEEFASDDLQKLGLNSIEGIVGYLKKYDITIKTDTVDEMVTRFKEHTKDTKIDYSAGELQAKPYLILGQFPVANSIYNDYASLEKQKIEHAQLEKLLLNTDKESRYDGVGQKNEVHKDLSEENLYLLTPLDYSQERAVNAAQKNSELVIYGPPGTGKSQTIANVISDNLARGKRILMVSQKKAALDVIYNRLANINEKVVLIHDSNVDKKEFYDKVASELENNRAPDDEKKELAIWEKSRRIDEDVHLLNVLGEKLTVLRGNGLSLQEMYAKTKKIRDREDHRYAHFKAIRSCSFLGEYQYRDIESAVQEIINKNVVEKYKAYKEYLSSHRFILNIKRGMDGFAIYDYIDKIDALFKKYPKEICCAFDCQDERAKMFFIRYKQSQYQIDKKNLYQLAEQITQQCHSDLLEKLNQGPWWSPGYWLNYSKNKKQEQLNRQKYESLNEDNVQYFTQCNSEIERVLSDIKFIHEIFNIEAQEYCSILAEQNALSDYMHELKGALTIYEQYEDVVSSLTPLTKLQVDILAYAHEQSHVIEEMVEVLQKVPEFSILFHIGKIENDERDILSCYKDFENIATEVKQLISKKQDLIPQHIIATWRSRLDSYKQSTPKQLKELTRQANKKRMLWPIRRCIEEFDPLILDIFPCWLLSPETVSEILPLKDDLFDMIIFDEASQLFVENAIPAIYRAKNVVIAGDDKQLRPSSSFRVKVDTDEEIDDMETAAALEEESLLDLAKVNYQPARLCYHYRALYDELINFSNYGFYGGRLEVSPNVIRSENTEIRPIERIMVDGRWVDRKNHAEAEKVVEIVADLLKNRRGKETIGVITFNITQKDLIEDMFEAKEKQDAEFRDLYSEELQRVNENEDVSLFVKNIENVQGDERDIIIFSTGYARNENNRLSVNFGSLSQDGGENRLNVAVSRSKKKIYVVTSFEPEELDVEDTKNNGPKMFKKYLQYVREVSAGNHEAVTTILNSLLDSGINRNTVNYFDSGFEEEVYNELCDRGYEVDTQVGVSGYRIDMAIYNPDQAKYVLGLECDGAAYHSSKSARERDIFRQRYLESRGWQIRRIWSRDWWENPRHEIDKIDELLKQQLH